jgi:hypothetical protein
MTKSFDPGGVCVIADDPGGLNMIEDGWGVF